MRAGVLLSLVLWGLIFAAANLLGGCASLDQAGTSSLIIQSVDIGGQPRCCRVEVRDGKQYASIDVSVSKSGDDYRLDLSARGVEAFRGQQIAADAASAGAAAAAKTATAVLVAPTALPAAAAALGGLTR